MAEGSSWFNGFRVPPRHGDYDNDGDLGFGVSFADFDNGGYQDLFMAGSLPIAGFNMIGPGRGNPGRLLLNHRDKTIHNAATFGLEDKFTTGLAVADFDNNGFADVVVVTSKFTRTGFDPDARPVLLRKKATTTTGSRSRRSEPAAIAMALARASP